MAIRHNKDKPCYNLLPAKVIHDLQTVYPIAMDLNTARFMWSDWYDSRRHNNYNRLLQATRRIAAEVDAQHPDGWETALAEVCACGAQIYGNYNWREPPYFAWSSLWRSTMSHRFKALAIGEAWGVCVNQEDSDLPHLWHELWGYVALLHYYINQLGTDDRPK